MARLYRLLLKLYPARFREEFGAPLERQFADEYRDAETAAGRAWLWLRALADLAVTVPAELLREIGQDLRYAARVYRKRALTPVLALSALALAIGATTGIFSVVNALLIRSLPFRQPERLVQILNPPVSPLQGRSEFMRWPASGAYLRMSRGTSPRKSTSVWRIGPSAWRSPRYRRISSPCWDASRLLAAPSRPRRTYPATTA
jgi:hypothetical protein